MHDGIKWWFCLGGTLKIIGDVSSNVSFHSESGVTLWFVIRFSSHIYARLSVAHQIHDHVDHQEAIQAYKVEMINYLLKKKFGT
jgi:hypothetical protein